MTTATDPAHQSAPAAAQSALRLVTELPVRPTPAGALHAAAHAEPDASARLLRRILAEPETPMLTIEALRRWTGLDEQGALTQLKKLQDAAWIEAIDTPLAVPGGSLDALLVPLLETLSSTGKALLADTDGQVAWTTGFAPERAAGLAGLASELALVHARYADALRTATGEATEAWALVDGSGLSRLGCWPIYIGRTRFVLVVQGLPHLAHPNFTTLVWLLVQHFG